MTFSRELIKAPNSHVHESSDMFRGMVAAAGLVLAMTHSTDAVPYKATLLHPAGVDSSAAYTVAGASQVGLGRTDGQVHALLWYGTAASVVDLNPNGYDSSIATGIADGKQIGNG